MPAISKSQLRWINSPSGHKVLGDKEVREWDKSSTGLNLPEHIIDKIYSPTVKKLKKFPKRDY